MNRISLVCTLFALLFTLARSSAQTAFTYQGQLKVDGHAATGSYDIQIALFDTASGGAQISTNVSTPGVAVANGAFSIELDFGRGAFDGTARWLELAVRPAGSGAFTVLMPRQRVAATPYALYAYGSASVADAAVTSQKLANGAVTSEKIAVSLAPQAGQVLSYNGTNLVWQTGAVNAWSLSGNSGTTPGANFLGTTDNRALEFKVNRTRALRLEPGTNSPNIIGGFAGNRVAAGVQGATVSGGGVDGLTNLVTDEFGTVAGGALNQAGKTPDVTGDTAFATVSGGYANLANAFSATISGGYFNTAAGDLSVVCGGNTNSITGASSFIGGGDLNLIPGQNSAIVGGMDNLADAAFAFIGGGELNTVNDTAGTVAGGGYNTSSFYGFVGGGYFNDATNDFAAVVGGTANIASGSFAFVGGGSTNTAFGTGATVPGGRFNIAFGDLSFAAGNRARANHRGAFVWGDSVNADIGSTANDQFIARASGGVTFYSNAGATTGVRLSPGGGAWSNASDRNAKENFARAEGREVLERLAKMPIQTWNYRSQDPSIRHMGPMAQDFRAAFNVGEDEKHISTVDADGVALAAIQGLHQVVKEKETKIEALEKRVVELEKLMSHFLEKQRGGVR